jgi:cytoskeletal protein CcmA (bactofilin family)
MLQPTEKSSFADRNATPVPAFGAPRNLAAALATSPDQATIGRSIVIKGEISGAETLYVDGRVDGSINLLENRVTIGRNGTVKGGIAAREVVVMGKVEGNLVVSDRVDIRSEGSVTGDVVAQRLSIEDGAFFKGSVDLGKSGKASDKKHDDASQPKSLAAHA